MALPDRFAGDATCSGVFEVIIEEKQDPLALLNGTRARRIFNVDTNPTLTVMRANVQTWGNSLALRIPKPLADQAKITQGSLVEIKLVDNVLHIESIAPQEYTLEALLEGVTQDNLHEEVDTGDAQGKEVW